MGPEIVSRAEQWADRTAMVDGTRSFTYRDLLVSSEARAATLLDGRSDLAEARVGLMVRPGLDYVAWQWAIWRAGGIALPLALTHPTPELAYVLDDARPETVVLATEFLSLLESSARERGLRVLPGTEVPAATGSLPEITPDRRAMMLYTSGTTGRPKGVVTTHGAIASQITSLVEAWGWEAADRILLVLPLHHVHGIINVVGCALWSGAACETLPRFDVESTWLRLGSGELTLFMAVPTVYHRLIQHYESQDAAWQRRMGDGCRALRLMVSGSAALPVPILEAWKAISGHVLLERYGMTEIGMALSNPLHGERRPGHVGSPLPGMEVRLVDEAGERVVEGEPGEIQVRGPNLFSEYWERPEATEAAFVDGWFRTGDIASRVGDVYRILGRASVDILKTGGEKVSALEIEEVLLGHPGVAEAAVVGLPDPAWGERIVAVVVPALQVVTDGELRQHCRAVLSPHKVPKEFHYWERLPRNALGKVTKPAIVEELRSTDS